MPQTRAIVECAVFTLLLRAGFRKNLKTGEKIMKKIMMILMIAAAMTSAAFGQMKMSKDSRLETEIIALERQTNEAVNKKDAKTLETIVPADALIVTEKGFEDRSQFFKRTFADECAVKSFSMDDTRFVMLDKNTVMVAYKYTQEAVCSGQSSPSSLWISSLYSKRGGKWLNTFFSLTPAK